MLTTVHATGFTVYADCYPPNQLSESKRGHIRMFSFFGNTLIAMGFLTMVSINGFPSTGYAERNILRVIII